MSNTASDEERVWMALAEIHHDLATVRGAICDIADAISGQRRPVPATMPRRRKAPHRDRHLRLVSDSAP